MFTVWSTILEKEGGWKKLAWTAEAKSCLPSLLSSQDEMDGAVGKGRVVGSICLSKASDTVSHNILHPSADVTVWRGGQPGRSGSVGVKCRALWLVGCALPGGC